MSRTIENIYWIGKFPAQGVTSLKGKIGIGYISFLRSLPQKRKFDLLLTLIHETGHYVLDNLIPNNVGSPDFGFNVALRLTKSKIQFNEEEKILLSQVDRLEGGFALQYFLFGQHDRIYYESASSEELFMPKKFMDPGSYANWPVYSEDELELMKVIEGNAKLSGIHYYRINKVGL